MKEQLLIQDVTLVTFFNDGYNAVKIEKTDILTGDGIIQKIDREIQADCPVISGSGKLAAPGLINSRSRSLASRVSKSIAEDMNFNLYGNTPMYTRVNPFLNIVLEMLTDEELAALLEPSVFEAAESGTTTLAEQCVGRELPVFLKLCEKYGLRTVAAPTLMSGGRLPEADSWGSFEDCYSGNSDGASRRNYEERVLGWNRELAEQYKNHETLRVCFGLGSADTLSERLTAETAAAAERLGASLMIPLYETQRELEVCRERFGLSPAEFFRKNHALHETTILGGLAFAAAADRSIIKSMSCHAAVCQYQAMLDGVLPPFIDFLVDDINAAVGTGRCSVNMLDQLRISALAGKLQTGKRYQMQASDAFYAATQAGADALHIRTGRLEEGCAADLLLVDLKNPRFSPLAMPVKELVYHTTSADISEVIVNGRIIKRDGAVLGANQEVIGREAEKAMDKVWTCARERGAL